MPKRKAEPPPADPLPPPAHLPPAMAEIWRETVAHMRDVRGAVDAADSVTLETFCAAVLRQRLITAEIAARPLVTDGKISPLLRVAEATAATVKNLAHVLGLNPMARQRLPRAPQKPANDKWKGILS